MRPPSRVAFVPIYSVVVTVLLTAGVGALADDVGVQVKAGGAQPAEPPAKLDPLPPAPILLDKVIRGFLEAAPGKETLDDVMRRAAGRDARAARVEQQRHMIRQQTQQFETMLQPLMFVELAFVKRTCGSLSPAARQEVLAAARQEVRRSAERLARLQFEGDATAAQGLDIRRAIHEKVLAAVEPRADKEELAAYERESRLRQERRAEAARIRLVARLDQQLGLSAAQRRALLDDLRTGWQQAWIRVLEDHDGLLIGGQPPAPDFAEASIVPHLDPEQAVKWRQWSVAASWKSVPPQHIDWSELNVQRPNGDQKLDPWWQP
jgi:hypothetical protein